MDNIENNKASNSYYLDKEIIEWLANKADKEKRSASWYLNEILIQIKRKKNGK